MIPPTLYLLLSILAEFAVFFIVTLSLNLEVGHTGIAQFGRVLAVEAGAFTVGGLTSRLLAWILGLPAGVEYADPLRNYFIVDEINAAFSENVALGLGYFVLSLVLAAIVGALLGWLTSRPAIRLKEAYLGISLLAYGEMLMWIAYNYQPIVGGTIAVGIPDPFRIIQVKGGPEGGFYRNITITFVMLAIALLMYFLAEKLTKSPFGRTLKMHRDCEIAASAYGLDLVKTRTMSLIVGSTLAALAGALYVFYAGACNAGAFSRLTWTFWPWAYMMLGGVGSNLGIAVGVIIFLTVRVLIVQYRFDLAAALHLPFDPIWLEYTIAGLAIILIVLFKPSGLIPEKPVTTLPRDKIKSILKSIEEKQDEKESPT
jgi:branched-chain amino acid transport system permease protein